MNQYDVAIIGGGPAGLKTAIELAKNHCRVIVIEENHVLGGKLNIQFHEDPVNKAWWNGKQIAEELINEAKRLKVEFLLSTQVWNIEEGWRLFVSKVNGESDKLPVIKSQYLVIATGAIEKGLPIKGWTLPKVLTVGGAQVLNNQYFVKPGNKVAIIGIDILSLSVARAMKLSGIEVKGIYLPPKNAFSKHLSSPEMVISKFGAMGKHAPGLFLKMGAKMLNLSIGRKLALKFLPVNGIKVWGIPIYFNQCVDEIIGKKKVEGISISQVNHLGDKTNELRTEQVDSVCISAGLTPQTELAKLINCELVDVDGLSGKVPLHNEKMQTSNPKLYVSGNITGIEGAEVCMQQGKIAGLSILKAIGKVNVDTELNSALKELKNIRENASFQFNEQIISGRNNLEKIWMENSKIID